MSLLYSTIRIISPSSVLRKLTRVMAVLFFLFWVIIVVLKTYRCVNKAPPMLLLGGASSEWECSLPGVVVFFELSGG